jgi:hypothetical protein
MLCPHPSRQRHGTILILVAGVSALLASMTLVFLLRMRTDSEESIGVLQLAQAKIMLAAACNYVQEASRLGWDANYPYYGTAPSTSNPPPTVAPIQLSNGTGVISPLDGSVRVPSPATLYGHQETYGWVDVRDGSIGPNYRAPASWTPGTPFSTYAAYNTTPQLSDGHGWMRPYWPAMGSVAICPMYVMQRPPYATQLTAVYNPIDTNFPTSTSPGDATFAQAYIQYPDPMPAVSNGWPQQATTGSIANALYDDGVNGQTRTDFVHGDPTPRQQTYGKAWFRLYRDGPETFIVTCGSGGTMGWKDWSEVQSIGGAYAMAQFGNDPTAFASLAQGEIRIWYRIEWSSAVMELTYHNLQHGPAFDQEHYMLWPANASHTWGVGNRTETWAKNPVGTIRWIERLQNAPTYY